MRCNKNGVSRYCEVLSGKTASGATMAAPAARAIVFAAAHQRREVWVGYPTYEAIIGNRIAPWYADWVLSRTGIKGQQTDEKASPDRENNVWQPVPEDRGAHGNFGNIAKFRRK